MLLSNDGIIGQWTFTPRTEGCSTSQLTALKNHARGIPTSMHTKTFNLVNYCYNWVQRIKC